jgi:hypothetical protein
MAGNQISVNDKAIATLALKFSPLWAGQLDKTISTLSSINIVAGDFTEAHNLVTLVGKRRDALVKNLTNIKLALDGISWDLNKVAEDYFSSNDDSKITVSELDTLVNDVGHNLPGFKKLQ